MSELSYDTPENEAVLFELIGRSVTARVPIPYSLELRIRRLVNHSSFSIFAERTPSAVLSRFKRILGPKCYRPENEAHEYSSSCESVRQALQIEKPLFAIWATRFDLAWLALDFSEQLHVYVNPASIDEGLSAEYAIGAAVWMAQVPLLFVLTCIIHENFELPEIVREWVNEIYGRLFVLAHLAGMYACGSKAIALSAFHILLDRLYIGSGASRSALWLHSLPPVAWLESDEWEAILSSIERLEIPESPAGD